MIALHSQPKTADNGAPLANVILPADAELKLATLGGAVTLEADGYRQVETDSEKLYRVSAPRLENQRLTAIPYAQWGNRGKGEMQVWIREKL